ncbi:MAG: ABC transporter permease [Anaerolineae bacterium]|nr:ABC transporter permease [Anaerolineae bacterium]
MLLRPLLSLLLTLWLAVTLAFFALRVLPGDAIAAQFAAAANPAAAALRREQLGLDLPLWQQYGQYLLNLLRGDAGVSLYSARTVTELIAERLPLTLELAGLALLLAAGAGISAGVYTALSRGVPARLLRLFIDVLFSVPVYWTATLALFSVGVLIGGVQGAVGLPALVVGLHSAAAVARLVRVAVLQTAGADFVRTARGKGLPERLVIRRHMLRAGLLPVVQLLALQSAYLMGGAVMTESIFQRPGMGLLLLDAVLARDYPVVQGVVLLLALLYTVLNTAADVFTALLDPRIRRA